MYGIKGRTLNRYYRDFISDFKSWSSEVGDSQYLLYPENISFQLSIDEVALSQDELYTVVTSKKAKGRKGCIVAIMQGVQSEKIIKYLQKIPIDLRRKVKEVTLDMASNMKLIAENCFTKASLVIDRFHVQQLASEALQNLRIKHRWKAIDNENEQIKVSKKAGSIYYPYLFQNGDSDKQLLARSRYLLYKSTEKWTPEQRLRAKILFSQYPDLKQAYNLCQQLRGIYQSSTEKPVAMTKLAHWYKDVEKAGFKQFNTVMNTISNNYNNILNYFENRSTNASAESFNAKIKAFRTQFRGVRDKKFFLYRLTQIYA